MRERRLFSLISSIANGDSSEITLIDALKAHLESKKVSPKQAKILLEYGERLIQEQRTK